MWRSTICGSPSTILRVREALNYAIDKNGLHQDRVQRLCGRRWMRRSRRSSASMRNKAHGPMIRPRPRRFSPKPAIRTASSVEFWGATSTLAEAGHAVPAAAICGGRREGDRHAARGRASRRRSCGTCRSRKTRPMHDGFHVPGPPPPATRIGACGRCSTASPSRRTFSTSPIIIRPTRTRRSRQGSRAPIPASAQPPMPRRRR